MDHSPFATLAAELRMMIWEYALQQREPIRVERYISPHSYPGGLQPLFSSSGAISDQDSSGSQSRITNNSRKSTGEPVHFVKPSLPHIFGLTLTCRAMHDESRTLFYSVNTFVIRGINTSQIFKRLEEFSKAIGKEHTDALRHVILDIGYLPLTSFEEACSSFDELQKFLACIENSRTNDDWKCSFRARAAFVLPRKPPRPALFTIDLDFADIERSWDDNTDAIREVIGEDLDYWNKIGPTLARSRENLRVVREGLRVRETPTP